MAVEFYPLYRTSSQILTDRSGLDGLEPRLPRQLRLVGEDMKKHRPEVWELVKKSNEDAKTFWLLKYAVDVGMINNISEESVKSLAEKASLDSYWRELGRPYYNVWPKVLKSFLRFDTAKVCPEQVDIPEITVAIRLPVGSPLRFGLTNSRVAGILLNVIKIGSGVDATGKTSDMDCSITMQLNCCDDNSKANVTACELSDGNVCLQLCRGVPIMQSVQDLIDKGLVEGPAAVPLTPEQNFNEIDQLLRLGLVIALLGKGNPEFLIPTFDDVTDAQRKALEGNSKAAEKHKAKHGTGFDLGREDASVQPHLRRWHTAWQVYGTGRQLRKLILRKGSIIHREKLVAVPSGWEDHIEPGNSNTFL